MYTIFINNAAIYITDIPEERSKHPFYNINKTNLYELFEKTDWGKIERIYLFHPDIKKGWKIFKKQFKIIKAAGGLVKNEEKSILFIYRNGVWDLPKGKIEKNEKVRKAAIREVEEECGIDGLTIEKKLQKTYHIYPLKGKRILKITYWFAMTSAYKGQFVPQIEEGITKVAWVSEKELDNIAKMSYPNIKLLVDSQ